MNDRLSQFERNRPCDALLGKTKPAIWLKINFVSEKTPDW